MIKLNAFDRIILSSLLLSMIVNIFSDYVIQIFPNIQSLLFPAVVILIIIWSLYFAGKLIYDKYTMGRYAVEVFLLNDQNELLLYYHPYHKKYLPPGGRVNASEFPDDAVRNRLKERIGLQSGDFVFHELFHPNLNSSSHTLGKIERIATPFLVQKELITQRGHKKFHYDFFYVLRLTKLPSCFLDNEYQPIRFVSKDTLKDIILDKECFPDVMDTYERILKHLNVI